MIIAYLCSINEAITVNQLEIYTKIIENKIKE